MSTDNRPPGDDIDLDRFAAGEQDHLPPAPEGAPDEPGSPAPEDALRAGGEDHEADRSE